MRTKIIETEHGEGRGNHGKFMLLRPDTEWERVSLLPTLQQARPRSDEEGQVQDRLRVPTPNLLGGVCGWGLRHLWVLDLQTGEGACFLPGGYAVADLDKHAVWVCPMFQPFLEWLYDQDLSDLDALPDVVQLPEAPFAFAGYRREGPGREAVARELIRAGLTPDAYAALAAGVINQA